MRNEVDLRIPCGEISLEGVLTVPEGQGPHPGAVVCHPHPSYGGSMHNNVVLCLSDALAEAGSAVLRFNFRGVGSSGGRSTGGDAEGDDVRAAISALAAVKRVDPDRLAVCGYSFGAWVGLRAGWDTRAALLIAVAPPLVAYELDFLAECRKPKLLIAGDGDPYCPFGQFRAWFDRLPEPKEETVIAGTDHFFGGREAEVGRAAASFVREWTRGKRRRAV